MIERSFAAQFPGFLALQEGPVCKVVLEIFLCAVWISSRFCSSIPAVLPIQIMKPIRREQEKQDEVIQRLLQMRLCQILATVHSPLSSDHWCSNDITPKIIASETRVIQHFEHQWDQNQPPLYRQLQSNFGCQPNFFQIGILALSATAGRDYHSWWKSHLTLPTLRSVWIKVMLRPKALRESFQFPADVEGSMTRKCHLTVQFTHSRPNLHVWSNNHYDFGRVRRYCA